MIETVIRVLFIGNSLTAANDLPATVQALAAASGVRVEYRTVAKPNFSLEDHWNDGEARRTIARGGWTFVVLQQGPSALPESQRLLLDYSRRFETVIRAAGATPAMYMVWPSRARAADAAAVSRSYTAAARAIGGVLCAAGDAWQAAWRADPQLPLYGADAFHPSPLGSALAAVVIVEALTGREVPEPALAALPPPQRAAVLAAAASVRARGHRGQILIFDRRSKIKI